MRSYTLHLPPEARPGDPSGLDRACLVPDGFVWGAFAFTVLWFLFRRLWLAALVVAAGLALVGAGGALLGLPFWAGGVIALLASVLVGLEASSLRRWTLARRGWPARDAVVAANAEEAEVRAMARWLDPVRAQRPARPAHPAAARAVPVIGLFPDHEGAR